MGGTIAKYKARLPCLGDLLSVMYTCGMYDFAGQWAYTVGLPAKSGVSGAILAVVPGRMGIAAYSPPLDAHGNSVRGVKALEVLSTALGLNILDVVPAETGSKPQMARWARRDA